MRRGGFACVIALSVAVLTQPGTAAAGVRSSASVVAALKAGHRLVLRDVTIKGRLDLGEIDTVQRLFECHDCTFTGPLLAHDVIFERTIDLSGSTFASRVNFTGATFRAPALFRAAVTEESSGSKPPCRFKKAASFSLAVFDDLASFDRSRFCGPADFRDAKFSDATFSGSWFTSASFARASFQGTALFNDAHFAEHASFDEADFRPRADFARTEFADTADFAETRFGEGASFLVSSFSVTKAKGASAEEAATFQDATSSGDLNFTFATFDGGIATFSGLVSSGSLMLHDAEFGADGVAMDQLQVRQLILDVDAVGGISDKTQRTDVLRMIEESAKERQDLPTANDAHYALRKLRSQDYGPVLRGLDYVFYRGVAGYFVRPLRPIVVLLVIVTLVALLRLRVGTTEPTTTDEAASRRTRFWRRTGRHCRSFFTCLLDTFAVAAPRWRAGPGALPLASRLEVVVYRLLVVCALIGIANSNPTLRQMVDSLL
jgi:uncharacterized protein YjbI with pentapeptide repeats